MDVEQLVADPYDRRSLSARARARRWGMFLREFPNLNRMEVVDLGGVEAGWNGCPIRPKRLTLVNVVPQQPEWAEAVTADACCASDLGRFDLAFSNSAIGHVGGHRRRQQFADVVHRLADRHWVQTPYRYFPVDPTWLFPGFFALPLRVRVGVARRWQAGFRSATSSQALEDVCGIELLTKMELEGYFPGSRILTERFAGLPKSIVAVR